MISQADRDAVFNAVLKERLEADLLAFIVYFHKAVHGEEFIVSKHHRIIIEHLLRIYRGEGKKNLIVNMPPRYGKTQIMIYFCAWTMAKHPKSKTIHLSYSEDLVKLNSRGIKDIVKSDAFKSLWAIEFVHEEQHHWITKEGGGFYAASTAGQVTGFGAGQTKLGEWGGFLWIDDPMKPIDANSDRERGKINAMISSTVRSRRNSRETPIIMVMQRLHDEDTTGYILGGATAQEWEHVSLPAISNGEALWPYKHTLEELELERANDRWVFASQYMQDPVPEDGEFFSKSCARYYVQPPKELTYYICSDIALSAGKGDYTEHAVIGVDKDDSVYIVDWYSGQIDDSQVVDELVNLVQTYRPRFIANEAGPTWKAIEGSLSRMLKEKRLYVSMEVVPAAGDKGTKAAAFQGLWRHNKVFFPMNSAWAERVLAQMYRFPFAKHDDAVDALSVFGRVIDKVIYKQSPKPKEKKPQLRVVKWM